MPTVQIGDLLEYNLDYKILICRDCQYAIQKSALNSHLLRHKIYRNDRQQLLNATARLELLEPKDVTVPLPGSPAIESLPVLTGFRCLQESCGQLTASSKRMKRHWSEFHSQQGDAVPHLTSFATPVKLQTFFRGTKVRYFEVTSLAEPVSNGDEDEDEAEVLQAESSTSLSTSEPGTVAGPSPSGRTSAAHAPQLDLEMLTYLHYFITTAAATLPVVRASPRPAHYWQNEMVQQALGHQWLMCGLLSVAASHMAINTVDEMAKQRHYEAAERLDAQFETEWTAIKDAAVMQGPPLAENVLHTGMQISCLLSCARRTTTGIAIGDHTGVVQQLQAIMTLVKDYVVATLGAASADETADQGFGRSNEASDPLTDANRATTMPAGLLQHLQQLPFRIAEAVGQPEHPQDVFSTLAAIAAMIECCEISHAADSSRSTWRGVFLWLNTIPAHFNQMIEDCKPAALLVVAEWAAVLVQRAERFGCWFLAGSAQAVLMLIAHHFETDGRHAALGIVQGLAELSGNGPAVMQARSRMME